MPGPFRVSTTAPHFAPFGPTGRHSTSRDLPVKAFRRKSDEKEVPVREAIGGQRARRDAGLEAGGDESEGALDLVRRKHAPAQAAVRSAIELQDLEGSGAALDVSPALQAPIC